MLTQNGDLRGSSVPSLLTKANPQALIGPEQGGPRAKTRADGPSPPRAHRTGQGSGLLSHPAHHVQACSQGPCAPPASSQGTNPACGRREHQARAHARGKDAVPPALTPRATKEPPRSSCPAHSHTVRWTTDTPKGGPWDSHLNPATSCPESPPLCFALSGKSCATVKPPREKSAFRVSNYEPDRTCPVPTTSNVLPRGAPAPGQHSTSGCTGGLGTHVHRQPPAEPNGLRPPSTRTTAACTQPVLQRSRVTPALPEVFLSFLLPSLPATRKPPSVSIPLVGDI